MVSIGFLVVVVVLVLIALSSPNPAARPLHLPATQTQTESDQTIQERSEVNEGKKDLAGGVPLRSAPGVKPKDIDPPSLTGGCVLGYGRGRQCLPVAPPSQDFGEKVPWTCKELVTLFPNGIAVNRASDGIPQAGVDPLKLDRNKDFTACNKGDF